MSTLNRWKASLAALLCASTLLACGGGSSPPAPAASDTLTQQAGAPVQLGKPAIDGLNWINYRRGQAGVPALSESVLIDRAAQGHSDYLRQNSPISHDQVPGKPGFTGAHLVDRLAAAGYTFSGGWADGEVISASNATSGAMLVEELITAIYHRFIILEPKFKEVGTGASVGGSTSYFTADFAASNGFGSGLGAGRVVTWPFDGQSGVLPNFFSANEEPRPVPGANEVGYPISVHADLDARLLVSAFSVRPHGGAALDVRLLAAAGDPNTPPSVAAIVPLAPLLAATRYDVSFSGSVNGQNVARDWSFSTK